MGTLLTVVCLYFSFISTYITMAVTILAVDNEYYHQSVFMFVWSNVAV